jgi:hypothetical protein
MRSMLAESYECKPCRISKVYILKENMSIFQRFNALAIITPGIDLGLSFEESGHRYCSEFRFRDITGKATIIRFFAREFYT